MTESNGMDNKITVYGKPGCQGCKATTKKLDNLELPYQYLDISVNEVAHQEVKSLGYSGVPVVVTNSGHWAGYSPDRLKGLKQVSDG